MTQRFKVKGQCMTVLVIKLSFLRFKSILLYSMLVHWNWDSASAFLTCQLPASEAVPTAGVLRQRRLEEGEGTHSFQFTASL